MDKVTARQATARNPSNPPLGGNAWKYVENGQQFQQMFGHLKA